MGNTKFTQEEIQKIIDLYNSGLFQREIAEIYNTSTSSVARCLRKNGITSKVTLSSNDIDEIILSYKNGDSIVQIAKQYGVGDRMISRILNENSILIRTPSVYNRKYTLNECYFDKINTPNKAYIIGLLYADGCVCKSNNTVSIALQEQDKDILDQINSEIGSNRPLRFLKYNDKNSNWHNQYQLTINSGHIVNKLIQLGIIPNKSLNIEFPQWLSEDLYFHFLRGYIDGDGCIVKKEKRVSLIGTEAFCIHVSKDLYNKLGIHSSISICHNNIDSPTRDLRISGGKQVKLLLDTLYNNADMYINRKYNLYKSIYCEPDNINSSLIA
jgi:intein-encoded DNA endonuclease-like protein